MSRVLYDSTNLKHKKPFGAIAENENIEINIYVAETENPTEVFFIYREDENDTPIYISMHESGKYDSYIIFSCNFKIDKSNLYFYRFEIKSDNIIKFVGCKNRKAYIEDWLPEWQLTVYQENFNTPDWVYGGIMYQIFPDRFCKSDKFKPLPSRNHRKIHDNWFDIPEFIYDNPEYKANDYYCGNIYGIIEKLDYIKSLGVNIIYLNPIFESPEYHRYSTGNYFNIDPYFGTNEQFKELTDKCHRLGIKVIIDGVFSHTGADSIYFNKFNNYNSNGAYNSLSSPYFNWYNFINYPNDYECWWGFNNLPNVNETNPDYLKYITGENGVIEYWQNQGCDGWRLDVADELPDEFLYSLYKASKSNNNNSFIIGEVWEDATNKFAYGVRRKYLLGEQMDSVMNYPFRTAILDFVTNHDEDLFNDRIYSILDNYPPQVVNCLMNSVSTHDTVRAITYLGVNHNVPDEEKGNYKLTPEEYETGKRLFMLATFLQYTLPGIPSIYYGDEAGLYGYRDPYCRMTYPFGREDFELIDFFKSLGEIRAKHKDDFISQFSLLYMENGLYAFLRGDLLCIINVSDEEKHLENNSYRIVWSVSDNYTINECIKIGSKNCLILEGCENNES